MKLLMWHCSTLRSTDIRRSSRPGSIRNLLSRPTTVAFSDVLVAFACVEEHDDEDTVARAAGEVLRQGKQIGRRDVVIVPFAHLSNRLMTDSVEAQALIVALGACLEDVGLSVSTNSFGYHKKFELHYKAKGYPGSVAFRSID
jgi:threonyl-tRNA synthetase